MNNYRDDEPTGNRRNGNERHGYAELDPSIADVGQSLRKELRNEARRIERGVEQAELQSRSIRDTFGEFHNRADLVSIATSQRNFNGFIEAWSNDYISVLGQTTLTDIAISAIDFVQLVERGTGRRIPRSTEPSETFAHHLSEYEDDRARLEIGIKGRADLITSCIAVVGQDHVVAKGDPHSMDRTSEWVIPLSSIAFIIRPRGIKKTRY